MISWKSFDFEMVSQKVGLDRQPVGQILLPFIMINNWPLLVSPRSKEKHLRRTGLQLQLNKVYRLIQVDQWYSGTVFLLVRVHASWRELFNLDAFPNSRHVYCASTVIYMDAQYFPLKSVWIQCKYTNNLNRTICWLNIYKMGLVIHVFVVRFSYQIMIANRHFVESYVNT